MSKSIRFALLCIQKPSINLTVHQKSALTSALSGNDTLVCLPTGHGKSLIFKCFPHCFDFLKTPDQPSCILVVSPLVSLMTSQVNDLKKRNQSALFFTGDITGADEDSIRKGIFKYVFLAPEAVAEKKWKSILMESCLSKTIQAVFVDEAHCVELWGGGVDPFRKSYAELASIQPFFTLQSFLPSSMPFVCVTATSSLDTKNIVCKLLNMVNPTIISVYLIKVTSAIVV